MVWRTTDFPIFHGKIPDFGHGQNAQRAKSLVKSTKSCRADTKGYRLSALVLNPLGDGPGGGGVGGEDPRAAEDAGLATAPDGGAVGLKHGVFSFGAHFFTVVLYH